MEFFGNSFVFWGILWAQIPWRCVSQCYIKKKRQELVNLVWGSRRVLVGLCTSVSLSLTLIFSRLLCAGEYDHRLGGQRHAGREGRQKRVYWPADQDADHWRRQENNTHRNTQPPLCHNDTLAGLPSQHTVSWTTPTLGLCSFLKSCLDRWPCLFFLQRQSCFQNMEICKRRVNMYDTVNQSKTPFITHVAPSTSTNLTMTFNNQLNTVHSQVSIYTHI